MFCQALVVVLSLAVLGNARDPTARLRNGVEMPILHAGVGGFKDVDATASIQSALEIGITGIDTAHDYGNFPGVAKALEGVDRSSYFLTSKVPGCGVPTQGLQPPCYNNTIKLGMDDINAMKQTYVDLLLLHFPPLFGCKRGSGSCRKMQEQWKGMEALYTAKKARAIGVSNYCLECLKCVMEVATVAPMVDQMETHIGIPYNSNLRNYCKSNGIVLEAYSPLAHGNVLKEAAVAKIANSHNKSTAQIALRFVSQAAGNSLSPFVTSSSKPKHFEEDLNVVVGDWSLTTTEMDTLESLTSPACVVEAPGGCCHDD